MSRDVMEAALWQASRVLQELSRNPDNSCQYLHLPNDSAFSLFRPRANTGQKAIVWGKLEKANITQTEHSSTYGEMAAVLFAYGGPVRYFPLC